PAKTVPSSLWTAGCCVKGGAAVGSFAVFGNDRIDPKETYTKQVSILGKLHMSAFCAVSLAEYPLVLNLYERFTAALNALNSSGKALLIATCPERLLYYGTNFNFNRVSGNLS
ncbi:unnamed protein product, partial [Pocillopora meandrina]